MVCSIPTHFDPSYHLQFSLYVPAEESAALEYMHANCGVRRGSDLLTLTMVNQHLPNRPNLEPMHHPCGNVNQIRQGSACCPTE
jgi:hypothetical protein